MNAYTKHLIALATRYASWAAVPLADRRIAVILKWAESGYHDQWCPIADEDLDYLEPDSPHGKPGGSVIEAIQAVYVSGDDNPREYMQLMDTLVQRCIRNINGYYIETVEEEFEEERYRLSADHQEWPHQRIMRDLNAITGEDT